jgi:hypothetical protein
MYKNLLCLILFAMMVMAAPVGADTLSGLADVTVVDGAIVSFRYEGTEYVVADEVLALGTTTRWYIPPSGVETLWVDGTPTPDATVSGTSTVKAGDVGPKADNFLFTLNGSTNISSIDGIDFQETVFPFLTKTFFHFERGGNDTGTWQAILADGSLGAPVAFSGATAYADTGVSVNGQNAYGVVFTTDVPVMGVRITASGHDTLSISALKVIPDFATRPNPADGSLHEQTWVTLGWSPGLSAVSHDVYLGDNFDEVNDDDGTGATFRGNQDSTTFIAGFAGFPYPDGLVPGATYYWRIDEINNADPNSPWKGDVWSFTIPPKTSYNPDPADGAGFVDPNVILTWTGGYNAKLHTIYLGDNYDDVNNATEGMPLGTASYDPGTLEREKVLYWRVDEFDGIETYKGDIWAFTTPGAVGNPQPANGAPDVPMTAKLSWTAADNASSHEVYFGTDADAVKNATTASPEYIGPRALGAESYDPGALAWDSSYAWRVDEVYPDGTVKGLIWTFTTADFILVDDFEAYNDIDPPDPASNTIFENWADGYQIPTNGAITANELPPYAEQTIVHGGTQSMKYLYDTNLMISESTLTLVYPKDWTQEGVTKLSLWYRGNAANTADRMFVALNGTSVVYHDDPAATQITGWKQWVIDLQAFADQGVDLTNVNTITIGLGTKDSPAAGGGTGKMYFDDIRLYR